MNPSTEYETAGPLNVEAIPECIEQVRREFTQQMGGAAVEFTARDDFAGIVGGLLMCAIAKVLTQADPSDIAPELGDLINDNLGAGPASLGYILADLAEVMLSDPLDQIPTVDR